MTSDLSRTCANTELKRHRAQHERDPSLPLTPQERVRDRLSAQMADSRPLGKALGEDEPPVAASTSSFHASPVVPQNSKPGVPAHEHTMKTGSAVHPVDIQARDGPATTLKNGSSGAQIEVNQPHASSHANTSTDGARKEARFVNSASDGVGRGEATVLGDSTMRASPPRQYGAAYSERNPAPNILNYQKHEKERQEASRKYLESSQANAAGSGNPAEASDPSALRNSERLDTNGPRSGATEDVPIGAEKSNVLLHPTPEVNFDRVFQTLEKDSLMLAYLVFGSIIVLDWLFIGGGLKGLFKSLFPASGIAGAVYFILLNVGKKAADKRMDQTAPKVEKLKYIPESVEWMNTLMETLWGTVQQELFDGIATQINETISPLIPKSVPLSVKIAELGHGVQSARVLSMRSLPDFEFGELVPMHGTDKSGSAAEAKARERAVELEEGGIFYNLEIAVAYHAAPMLSRKEHMHVDILALVGPVPVPIFVEVKEFVATIRLRLQMHPDLPFLKNVTFALTETPKITTCVSLGAPWALNLLNLPIIDNIVASQITAATADFVQPKSMSMDMTVYIGGSDQKEDTEAIGVLCVKIHKATNLARQDSRGAGADPYLTIAFSKYEKPMYATRIIKGDLNPVWEESAIIMIKAEHVKRKESVLMRLWDSDTMGADDVSGVCEVPLQDLILKSNKMHKRRDALQGDVSGTDAQGILEWEVGYFPKADWQPALRTDATDPRDVHGKKIEVAEADKTQNAQNTVPDPNLPSGILALTIHQLINVKVDNPNKKSMGHVKVQRQDSDGENEDDEMVSVAYIPTMYVTAEINDQLVYRTRTKSINAAPTFNSTTEQYVRDWRVATLTVSCWDTRKKTDDCLVGVTALKLSDIFNESSSVVRFYDLAGGHGTGRIRISMIFRAMRMKLEKSLLGYSVGSFVFTSPIVIAGSNINSSKLKIKGSGSKRSIKKSANSESDKDTSSWELDHPNDFIPIHYRYLSPIVLEFISSGISEKLKGPLGRDKNYAVLWLYKLIDNENTKFTLPVYKTNNPERLTQNVVTQSDDTMTLEKVGEVSFCGKFKAGLDETHEEFLGEHDQWSSYQSWAAAKKSGK